MSSKGKDQSRADPNLPSSLTPYSRSEEATEDAFQEGLIHGIMTLLPVGGALFVAMQNPTFVRRTNWQSRTAMLVMPALFMFTFTSEQKHLHKMREIAQETEHGTETVKWAERALEHVDAPIMSNRETEDHLLQLYRQSVEQSGVNVVPGNQLGFHHKVANYSAENPVKVLASMAIPTVAYIFYGNSKQAHLVTSVKIMHTRVFGQFATISLLLGIMGFTEFMNRNGKYITQAQADARVEEMQNVRKALMERLDHEKKLAADLQRSIREAHKEDAQSSKKPKKRKNVMNEIYPSSS